MLTWRDLFVWRFDADAAKALCKRGADLMQMPRRLLPTMTVYSATPSHAQNEREIYSRSEDEEGGGGREGGRQRPPTNMTACAPSF